jgi:hypothetical protein
MAHELLTDFAAAQALINKEQMAKLHGISK